MQEKSWIRYTNTDPRTANNFLRRSRFYCEEFWVAQPLMYLSLYPWSKQSPKIENKHIFPKKYTIYSLRTVTFFPCNEIPSSTIFSIGTPAFTKAAIYSFSRICANPSAAALSPSPSFFTLLQSIMYPIEYVLVFGIMRIYLPVWNRKRIR